MCTAGCCLAYRDKATGEGHDGLANGTAFITH
jgi:hypothetical protein